MQERRDETTTEQKHTLTSVVRATPQSEYTRRIRRFASHRLTAEKLAARLDRLLRDSELRERAAVIGETIRAGPTLTNASRLLSGERQRVKLRPSLASMSAASP